MAYKILYKAIDFVKLLSNNEAGILIKNVVNYTLGKELNFQTRIDEIAFLTFKNNYLIQDGEHNVGAKNWNWKGGITPENRRIRNSSKAINWRKSVLERDKYKCQKCGAKNVKLHAHHIKHFALFIELRFDLSNGMTLCEPCHILEHKMNKI